MWESQSGQPPSDRELASLVDEWVRDEVFYREALRLRLDDNDSIIRRRLIQKLDFIAEDVAEPDEAALRRYYDEHLDRYRLPTQYTFSQVFFAPGHERALETARQTLARHPDDWRRFGDPGMLNAAYASQTAAELTGTFGKTFADALAAIEPGPWAGPVMSAYGMHLVRVTARLPARTADFAKVERAVLSDYLDEQRKRAREQYYATLLARYRIVGQ